MAIYYIDAQVISNHELVKTHIYSDMELNYYWSDSFEPNFYVQLAQAGFISTAMEDNNGNPILLPEIQFEYALLDFKDLHISKKVQKLLDQKQYHFKINTQLETLMKSIHEYHESSWLNQAYQEMLLKLKNNSYDNFELMSIELYDLEDNLIAGEIGYSIGTSYTSLTGFFKREAKYNNWGKLQLVLLAQYLQKQDYAFWNLGHASLQYKLDLGAQVLSRHDFLKRWEIATLPK